MKTLIALSAGLLLLGSTAAVAGQPENPGQFGRDRAAGVQSYQEGGKNDAGEPGASEWGQIAGERAGDNGQKNRDYKDAVGGSPTKGNDK